MEENIWVLKAAYAVGCVGFGVFTALNVLAGCQYLHYLWLPEISVPDFLDSNEPKLYKDFLIRGTVASTNPLEVPLTQSQIKKREIGPVVYSKYRKESLSRHQVARGVEQRQRFRDFELTDRGDYIYVEICEKSELLAKNVFTKSRIAEPGFLDFFLHAIIDSINSFFSLNISYSVGYR